MAIRADILIVTVTKVEGRAVMRVVQEITGHSTTPEQINDRTYHNLGIINGARVYMAVSEMGTGGLGASLQTIQKAIETLQPSAVIMTGIAFGINEQKQSIGDVLISTQILLYELQRVGQERTVSRGDKAHASGRLISLFRSADLYWDKTKVEFGLILTGDKLVDNMNFRDQLIQVAPESIGGEMEGAGLYVASQDARVDWILVKAICDWADGNKSQDKKERQELAAYNAASFTIFALQHVSFVREKEKSNNLDIIKAYRDRYIAFIRKLQVEWNSEKDSAPINTDHGKWVLQLASNQVVDFRADIERAEGTEIIQILDQSLRRLRAIQSHSMYIDGGRSFNQFWIEGDEIIAQLQRVVTELDKVLEQLSL